MADVGWRPQGADETGFTSLYKVRKRAKETDRASFARSFPVPALLVQYEGDPKAEPERPDSGVKLLTAAMHASGVLRYLNKIGFLCKRPGNPYAHLIAIGRSHTNDLVLAIDSVSKVHGYFVHDRGGWSFTDRRSTNGSRINERPLEPGIRTPIRDSDRLRLGSDTVLEMLEPASLFERLRKLG